MALVYTCLRDGQSDDQDDQGDSTSIKYIPSRRDSFHLGVWILNVDVAEEEQSVEGFHKEFNLW